MEKLSKAADPVAEMRTALVNAAAEHRRKHDFEYWSDEEVADFALIEVRRELEELAKGMCDAADIHARRGEIENG